MIGVPLFVVSDKVSARHDGLTMRSADETVVVIADNVPRFFAESTHQVFNGFFSLIFL
jgi:hypothetical protein